MNKKSIVNLALALLCIAMGCATGAKRTQQMTVRDLHLSPLSPVIALAQFHDSWKNAIVPSKPPPFMLACETNRIVIQGSFSASAITPAEFFRAYCECIAMRYTSYTNGIVFFPVPEYDAGIEWQKIPVGPEVAASLRLGDGDRQHVEEALQAFGLAFPLVGCKAWYDSYRQFLIIAHVPIELKKARFLVDQALRGVATDDVAIDPSLHVAPFYYFYEYGVWTKHEKK